ncbi:hypothetical protein [Mesorhizobium sp. CAU 1741]|uniref:hypothetical protein n=1 Tax=Mesorhizobium sp. CAU 1741 TaxID=3140366 RepID=UPI00325BD93F
MAIRSALLLACVALVSACSTTAPAPRQAERPAALEPAIVPLTLEQEWEIAGVRPGS